MSIFLNNESRAAPFTIDTEVRIDELHINLKSVARAVIGVNPWLSAEDGDISVTQLEGGLSNMTYCLLEKKSGNKVIVRVFGAGTSDFINRDVENKVCCTLSRAGIAATFYGRFQNGRVEEFLTSNALTAPDMTNEILFPLVAATVCRVHQTKIPEICDENSNNYIWHRTEKYFSIASAITFDQGSTKQLAAERVDLARTRREYDWAKSSIEECRIRVSGSLAALIDAHTANYEAVKLVVDVTTSAEEKKLLKNAGKDFAFEICFCHNDLVAGNIMLSADFALEAAERGVHSIKESWSTTEIDSQTITSSGSDINIAEVAAVAAAAPTITAAELTAAVKASPLTLIDYEYSAYNFRAYDLANHFMEYTGFELDMSKFPSDVFRRRFLSSYLNHATGLPGLLFSNESFIQGFDEVVCLFLLEVNIFWAVWSVLQSANATIDFDYLAYARLRNECYHTFKKQFAHCFE